MSILVNIYYSGKDNNAKKFVNEMINKGIVNKIRNENGNLQYDYFYPIDDNETVLLIDRWQDEESLNKHHKSEMMKEIASLRLKYKLHMKVFKYQIL